MTDFKSGVRGDRREDGKANVVGPIHGAAAP
jgi:hypothetical protein